MRHSINESINLAHPLAFGLLLSAEGLASGTDFAQALNQPSRAMQAPRPPTLRPPRRCW